MKIGELIMLRRRRAKLSQDELAEKTGVSRVAINSYEAGRYRPSPKTLEAIETALGTEGELRKCLINEVYGHEKIPAD